MWWSWSEKGKRINLTFRFRLKTNRRHQWSGGSTGFLHAKWRNEKKNLFDVLRANSTTQHPETWLMTWFRWKNFMLFWIMSVHSTRQVAICNSAKLPRDSWTHKGFLNRLFPHLIEWTLSANVGYQNWNFIEHDLFFVAGWLLEHRKTKTCTSPGWALRDLALSTDVKPMHHSTVNKYPLTHRVRQHIFGGMHLMCVCVLVKEDEIIVGFWARTFPRKGCRRNFQPAHMMVIYCLELRVNFSKRAFMPQDWPQLFLRYTTCNYVLKG